VIHLVRNPISPNAYGIGALTAPVGEHVGIELNKKLDTIIALMEKQVAGIQPNWAMRDIVTAVLEGGGFLFGAGCFWFAYVAYSMSKYTASPKSIISNCFLRASQGQDASVSSPG
jgi:hypothetical protein